jgi:hypothetical protein
MRGRAPRRTARERFFDHPMSTIGTCENVSVPETQYSKTLRLQVGIALLVSLRLKMLPAIYFDDQSRLEADEVHYVSIDWLLPAETPPFHPSVAQQSPHGAFGIRHFLAEPTCVFERLGRRFCHPRKYCLPSGEEIALARCAPSSAAPSSSSA